MKSYLTERPVYDNLISNKEIAALVVSFSASCDVRKVCTIKTAYKEIMKNKFLKFFGLLAPLLAVIGFIMIVSATFAELGSSFDIELGLFALLTSLAYWINSFNVNIERSRSWLILPDKVLSLVWSLTACLSLGHAFAH